MPSGHALEHVAISRNVIATWDSDTRFKAQEQASRTRDNDAAIMLQAHVVASSPTVQESDIQSTRFKPMALYARMAKFYRFSDTEMRKMHYPRFFGYIREANTIIEERKREQERQQGNHRVHDSQMVDDPDVAQIMMRRHFGNKPQEYTGQTIQLND